MVRAYGTYSRYPSNHTLGALSPCQLSAAVECLQCMSRLSLCIIFLCDSRPDVKPQPFRTRHIRLHSTAEQGWSSQALDARSLLLNKSGKTIRARQQAWQSNMGGACLSKPQAAEGSPASPELKVAVRDVSAPSAKAPAEVPEQDSPTSPLELNKTCFKPTSEASRLQALL